MDTIIRDAHDEAIILRFDSECRFMKTDMITANGSNCLVTSVRFDTMPRFEQGKGYEGYMMVQVVDVER